MQCPRLLARRRLYHLLRLPSLCTAANAVPLHSNSSRIITILLQPGNHCIIDTSCFFKKKKEKPTYTRHHVGCLCFCSSKRQRGGHSANYPEGNRKWKGGGGREMEEITAWLNICLWFVHYVRPCVDEVHCIKVASLAKVRPAGRGGEARKVNSIRCSC